MTYPDPDTLRQMRAHSPKPPTKQVLWLLVLCGTGVCLLLAAMFFNRP
jgi:hypothetical protein